MRPLLAAALLLALANGCGSEADAYCETVAERQRELSEIVGSGEPDALLRALEPMRALREDAPGDIGDEWQHVVSRIEALATALADAGVDPAAYDRDQPPEGVTDAQRSVIDAAARELGSATTAEALRGLDQHARDVCHTPLTL